MASAMEVKDACKKVDDNLDIEESLTTLANIVGGSEPIDIIIRRGDEQFNLNRMKSILEAQGSDFDGMVAGVESAVLDSLGADEVTADTIRKALRDLVDANDVAVAAT